MPQPIDIPTDLRMIKKVTIKRNVTKIPAAVAKKLGRRSLALPPEYFIKDKTLIDKTGSTQGIKLSIIPPIMAKMTNHQIDLFFSMITDFVGIIGISALRLFAVIMTDNGTPEIFFLTGLSSSRFLTGSTTLVFSWLLKKVNVGLPKNSSRGPSTKISGPIIGIFDIIINSNAGSSP